MALPATRGSSAERLRLSFGSDESTAAGSEITDPFVDFEKVPLNSSPLPRLSLRLGQLPSTLTFYTSNPHKLSMSSRWLLKSLVPSFLSDRLTKQSTSNTATTAKPKSKISSLDGLRGLACLFVFNEHYTYNFSKAFLDGYGIEEHRSIIQWPGIRLFWSGFSMVAIFFVISGYVLSYKPLQQIRNKKASDLQRTLTSAVFRRAFRLFLPPIIAVLITGFFVYLGAFNAATAVWNTNNNYLHLHEPTPPHYTGLINQMEDAMICSTWLLNIWNWSGDNITAGDYDLHTWTMPVEFRCSMALFLMLMATARLRQTFRLLLTSVFIIFCIAWNRKFVPLFLAGMLLAELDMLRQEDKLSIIPTSRLSSIQRSSRVASISWLLLFAVGVWLASAPLGGCDQTPGFVTLTSWVPASYYDKSWFLRSIGAVAITWAAVNSERLKPLFTNAFSIYLGQISFALYLVHGNVLKSVGYASMPWIYAMTGVLDPETASAKSMVAAWFIGLILVLPITFWASDLFWRGIDVPCVRFARWIEEKMSEEIDEDEQVKVSQR